MKKFGLIADITKETGSGNFNPDWGSGVPGVADDLVIKIFSSTGQDSEKFGPIKSFWTPVTTPRNQGQTSKLDLDLFKKNGYVPTVQLLGEWKDFSVGNKDLEVILQGQVNQNTSIFSGTDVSTLSFEEVSFVCEGLSDCDQWRKSNPNGVRLEFDAPFEVQVHFISMPTIPMQYRRLMAPASRRKVQVSRCRPMKNV